MCCIVLMLRCFAETRMHIGTGEIKCIASKDKLFYSERSQYSKYGAPLEYYGQIQIEMEVLDAEWNDFIVHTPTRTQVTRFYRNREFFNTVLLPALQHAYHELFLPQLQARADGVLTVPQTLLPGTGPVPRQLRPAASTVVDADEDVSKKRKIQPETTAAAAPKPAAPLTMDLRAYFARQKK